MINRGRIERTIAYIGIILMITITGCNNIKESHKVQEPVAVVTEKDAIDNKKSNIEALNPETQEMTETEEFKSGEQAVLGDIKLTINSIREQESGVLLDPEPGNTYKILNITIENTGAMEIPISTMLAFYILDNSNNRYCVSLTCGTEGNIGKTLSPRSAMEGEIAFEVNKNADGLKLIFEPGIFGQASINL